MALKKYKPTSPSRRATTSIDYSELDKVEPYGPLTSSISKKGGRNNLGRITVRHKGGGHKRKYRIIDWKRSKIDIEGKVEYVEYDPNRTAFIARILYVDGERRYILAPSGIKKGDKIIRSEGADILLGNCLPLVKIPFGTDVHNIEMYPGSGAKIARSAGAKVQLVGRVDGMAQLKLPSGELRLVPETCIATIGQVGNEQHFNVKLGKAGRSRWKGVRPTVRGVAMNPVDHPHGGGEGRTSGGRHPVTPWAIPTKGHKTRKNKRTNKFIVRRRPANKKGR